MTAFQKTTAKKPDKPGLVGRRLTIVPGVGLLDLDAAGKGWRAPFLSDRCPTWIADLGGRNRVTQGRRNYTAEYREEAVR